MEYLFFYFVYQINKFYIQGGENMLTPKQEKFCQCIVSGMSGKDAYNTAYNSKSDRTAYNESVILLKRDDVTQRIHELLKPVQNRVQADALSEYDRLKTLAWERIEQCKQNNDDTGIARYMDIVNKMNGTYININKNIEQTDAPIDHLDAETLKRLAGA